jgi:hypothetical protein
VACPSTSHRPSLHSGLDFERQNERLLTLGRDCYHRIRNFSWSKLKPPPALLGSPLWRDQEMEATTILCAECVRAMALVKNELLIRIACANCQQAERDKLLMAEARLALGPVERLKRSLHE